ncbi:Sn1-specific diacylglycerol lipase alpha [Schistosoma japonicum]|uniref:sn-1-specific diacylglycerol lipase n=2 Tax=Schistosoma japonicum TaxID=6182 RepID=A0A4Z2D9V3_SCHJA|nr:Sn1-specific diacylglycerol lipase beta [Schistosoma japonicum]TNN13283.1 Sn1-specific diacylglycerol lipase alpha [Schistosoma japonicum]
MPALIFLGRTWACASDDFVCAGVCNFLIRMSCVLILGVPFLLASDPAVCLPNLADKIFCVLMFLTLAALLIFDAALSLSSSKGGVMETNLRSSVPRLLGAVCTLSCILLVLNLANLYLASNIYTSCDKQVVNCYIAGNSIAMAHAIGFYFSLILHYRKAGAFWGQLANDPTVFKQGCLHPNVNLSTKQLVMLQRRKSVQRKLRSLGAFRRLPSWKNDQMNVQTEERVITSAAALFSDVFYDVDLVASDIVAGLLLLRWQTKQWVGSGHRIPLSLIYQDTSPSVLNIDVLQKGDQVPDQWLDIQRIYRIAELTTAMYGKFLYYSMNLGIPGSTCRLFRHLPCCLNSCNSTSEKTQLSCCICSEHTCDLAAILEFTSLKEDQFVKLSYDNSVYQSPYFVAVDDVSHCIVISIRGTLSFDDTIVDLLYDGVRLTEVETFVESKTGKRPCFIGHRGMVERSRHLFNSLLTDRSLEIAFSKKPHYKLVVCGHSLGAGIASFLSAILRSTYPDVKGYAFSAPLGMMNQELANYCKPFLLSVVYGYDVFSRMNKSTISDFKWRLLDALSACKVPKHRLLSRGLFVCMRRCLCKWCLPKCFQVESSTTVGSDTLLLDTTTQEHLIYSFPQLHYHNDEMRIRLSLHDDTNNSGSTSVHRAARSSRFRPGPRSLLCWINPSSLLPISSQSTDPISNNHCTNDNGNNDTETDSDSSDRIHSSDPESYDLSNGVFGGLVLHLVDVNLDTTDNDSPTGCIVNEDFFEDVGNSPSVYNSRLQALLSTKSNRMSTCCKSRKPKKIIAGVWSSPQQFQTILVHPQMLTHHLPNRFLEAVDCLRQVLLSTSSNSYDNSDIFKGFKPSDFIRKLDISS